LTQHRIELRLELVSWLETEFVIRGIREAVFMVEQGVPEELEWDGFDPLCVHVIAWNDIGEAIGTARMQPEGRIGRMAVRKEWRGQGVGCALLQTLLDLATKRGLSRVTLAAQIHALGFYERAGFHAIGGEFMDAGIPHRMMVRELLLPHAGQEKG
jgi:predicted GNAT family N-acyltransferase